MPRRNFWDTGWRGATARFSIWTLSRCAYRPLYGPNTRFNTFRKLVGNTLIAHLCRAAAYGDPVSLAAGGDYPRDWTYAADAAQGIALAFRVQAARHTTYNIAAGRSYTVRDVVDALRRIAPATDVTVGSGQWERRPCTSRSTARGALDISRAREDLGYEPRYALEDGLGAYVGIGLARCRGKDGGGSRSPVVELTWNTSSCSLSIGQHEGAREGSSSARHRATRRAMPICDPGWVLVKVRACGISGSEVNRLSLDQRIYAGRPKDMTRQLPTHHGPRIFGNSRWARRRRRRASGGYPVVIQSVIGCGACESCDAGLPNHCDRRITIGVHADGAFAEYTTVPAANVYPAPPGVSLENVALLQPFAIAAYALEIGGVRPGDRIGVWGVGAIGVSIIQQALLTGINVEFAVGRDRDRVHGVGEPASKTEQRRTTAILRRLAVAFRRTQTRCDFRGVRPYAGDQHGTSHRRETRPRDTCRQSQRARFMAICCRRPWTRSAFSPVRMTR